METAATNEALQEAAQRALAYVQSVRDRPVTASARALQRLEELKPPLPQTGLDAREVVRRLDEIGSPATMATAGGWYFGLVIGGALPATVAANWLATAWDQNACFRWTSPIAAALEDVSLQWLGDLFGLPSGVAGAFVTGTSMANMAALASARHALLSRQDWDVEAEELYGAPELRVIVSEEVHIAMLKALSLLGFGRERVIRVPTDRQGRLRIDSLPMLDDRTIVCIQAGNVNTGDFDPAAEVCRRAKEAGAWVHVDGAFGLWALANPQFVALTKGLTEANSWATDGHKWLNVPYDSGIVLVRRAADLRAAMSASAAYLAEGVAGDREPSHYTPESSRRARGVEIWAALLNLGRGGVADLVERSCRHARAFAQGLKGHGFEILSNVVLNQVLVSFGSPEHHASRDRLPPVRGRVLVRRDCVAGCHCYAAISVSNWATTEADVELSIEAMVRAAEQSRMGPPA